MGVGRLVGAGVGELAGAGVGELVGAGVGELVDEGAGKLVCAVGRDLVGEGIGWSMRESAGWTNKMWPNKVWLPLAPPVRARVSRRPETFTAARCLDPGGAHQTPSENPDTATHVRILDVVTLTRPEVPTACAHEEARTR